MVKSKFAVLIATVGFFTWILAGQANDEVKKADASKKNVFIIGDSIHIGYSKYLKAALDGSFELVTRDGWAQAAEDLNIPKGSNSGPSGSVLKFLQEVLPKKKTPMEVLLINAGLHDIKTKNGSETKAVPEETYRKNLQEIVKLGKENAKYFVWINTTPVIDELHAKYNEKGGPGFDRFLKDVVRYNEIAAEIMKENNIMLIDLFTFTKNLGGEEMYCDHVHYKPEIQKKQGEFIAEFVKKNCL